MILSLLIFFFFAQLPPTQDIIRQKDTGGNLKKNNKN